ncbi:MAG: methyltransferase domain-containing protein [Candidatus Lokiarchaeota archaeon]|nr:methyltransferase domain-containing protein [Candidatus Lokiarchaeota archaeon]MBD3202112.1 methyltransferase domain-containing protein [Candidatus Lokiarchaeota archaeon]
MVKRANRGIDKKSEIKQKYEASSSIYDQRYKNIQFEKYKQIISEIQFKDNIICDAGCGTGLFIEFMCDSSAKNLDNIFKYIGIDISLKMLEIFKSKVNKNNDLSKKISLVLADLENLPFRSHSVDTLLSVTAYQNLPKIISAIEESFRILRERSNFHISILKKKIVKDQLLEFLNSKAHLLKIIDKKMIEDYIIQGDLKQSESGNL